MEFMMGKVESIWFHATQKNIQKAIVLSFPASLSSWSTKRHLVSPMSNEVEIWNRICLMWIKSFRLHKLLSQEGCNFWCRLFNRDEMQSCIDIWGFWDAHKSIRFEKKKGSRTALKISGEFWEEFKTWNNFTILLLFTWQCCWWVLSEAVP